MDPPVGDLAAGLAHGLPLGLALVVALSLRPWRLLGATPLWTPLLASVVLLPWLWALPRLYPMPLGLQLSMACLVTLMLGWPLAVLVLPLVAVLGALIAPADVDVLLAQALWQGVVPATLALGLGALLRRWLPHQVFIYILGRGFLGTALCVFASALLARGLGGAALVAALSPAAAPWDQAWVPLWLMAWADAFLTGLLTAVFVAFRPDWLATWSDRLYLKPPAR